jgi:hypothetical protein
MAATGLLAIIVLVCGGILSIAAVAVVIYLIVNQREK